MLKSLSTRLRAVSLNSLSLSRTQSSPVSSSGAAAEGPPRLLVVQPRHRPEVVLRAKLDEALSLANSLEEQRDGFFDTEMRDKEIPPHIIVQNPASRTFRADTFFGAGTVDTVKCHLHTKNEEDEIDAVFVNDILTGVQQRNLERLWGKPVLDRVGLIIEIFNAHAYTKEGKLQAELAALMYKRSRLVRLRGPSGRYTFGSSGEAQVVSARGRGSGGRGFISGAGETELQLQRRRITERRKQLLSEIKEVRRTRALQRASRKRHGSEDGQTMPTVAVVGYTNAGKSTLVSALSNTDLYSDDRLFATVDPKLRSVILPSGRKALFSDTVGFISDLPVQLVEAFHATLEEVVEADLLVHVLDASAPNLDEHRNTVLQVLQQIGVSEEKLKNMIEVWNKIDLQDEMAADTYLDDGEENDSTLEQSSEEALSDFDDNNEDNVSELSSRDEMETVEDEYSDNWILSEDEEEKTLNKMGWLTSSDQKTKSPEDLRKDDITPYSHSSPHVKTSALMGIGLHELLELIDDRLKCENVVERNVLDRKWRPPRVEEAYVAVG